GSPLSLPGMIELSFDPALPKKNTGDPFLQTIRVTDQGKPVAIARWHCGADNSDGVVQILDLVVTPIHRRQGHGDRLMEAIVDQASKLSKLKGTRLRRLWLNVEQKTQVAARSFLMDHGFHHVATI